jgi:predicted butyrate kinase (DUF1464 family)
MRVIGIDPGTVSIDLVGLADGEVWLDHTFPTREALADPAPFLALLREGGTPDLIAGPSGYGLPLLKANAVSEEDLRLAYLAPPDEAGGIGGLRRLARLLGESGLPVVFTPGVIHLPTVPAYRKLNRVDMGTADKVAAAALALWMRRRERGDEARPSFILLELGGAFSAALAVREGAIVDGVGGSSGPIGWKAAGAWDGEVGYLAREIRKEMLFGGGRESLPGPAGFEAYVEGIEKAARALLASVGEPGAFVLSGRHAADPEVLERLRARLGPIAPVRRLEGYARVAKEGAQGAALLADGLAGGREQWLVESLRLTEARGTVLDYLTVISPNDARARLGLPSA